MLRDTARRVHGRGRRDHEAAAPLARHGLQGRLRPRAVEAVRPSLGFTGILHRRRRDGGLGLGAGRGGHRARGDRPQPDALALPDHRGRRGRARSRAPRTASAGSRASSSGETVAALAIDEGQAPCARSASRWRAERPGNGFRLVGRQAVRRPRRLGRRDPRRRAHGGIAGETGGITLFAVEQGASGLEVENVALADSSKAARLSFDNVAVDADAVSARSTAAGRRLSRALNAGRAGAAAELVGVAAGAWT